MRAPPSGQDGALGRGSTVDAASSRLLPVQAVSPQGSQPRRQPTTEEPLRQPAAYAGLPALLPATLPRNRRCSRSNCRAADAAQPGHPRHPPAAATPPKHAPTRSATAAPQPPPGEASTHAAPTPPNPHDSQSNAGHPTDQPCEPPHAATPAHAPQARTRPEHPATACRRSRPYPAAVSGTFRSCLAHLSFIGNSVCFRPHAQRLRQRSCCHIGLLVLCPAPPTMDNAVMLCLLQCDHVGIYGCWDLGPAARPLPVSSCPNHKTPEGIVQFPQ